VLNLHGGVIGKVECPRIEILHLQTPSSARLDTPKPADARRPSHDPHLFISTAEFPCHRKGVRVATTGCASATLAFVFSLR
jgi:hypothetical protein